MAQTTLLRIKRKRGDALPLEALVIEEALASKRQKFFRFAETVSADFFRAGAPLTSDAVEGLIKSGHRPVQGAPHEAPPASAATQPRKKPLGRGNSGATANAATNPRFIIVESAREEPDLRFPKPPAVVSVAEAAEMRKSKRVKIIDAVDEREAARDLRRGQVKGVDDPELKQFIPMLEEYLTLQDSIDGADRMRSDQDEEDFVYDVYYRVVDEGTQAGAPVVDSLAGLERIGALSGYSDKDVDDLLQSDTKSASDIEDEADEDSNDENDYRNDYPEDEFSDSAESWSDNNEIYRKYTSEYKGYTGEEVGDEDDYRF